jgi:hypothetical protein
MYQSSTRNNFLDILIDPTTIAILGSIALHAIIAASFPFLFQPDKPGKKVDTGSVKVVELTPNELQRIPQAPPPIIPQTLPPVYQPSVPVAPAAPPRAPKISTAPQTIPSSPIRTPPKTAAKPAPITKGQTAKPQVKPSPPAFDPNISFDPNPLPSKVSAKPDLIKPTPPVSLTPAKPTKQTSSPQPTPSPGIARGQTQPSSAPGGSGSPSPEPSVTPQPNGSPTSTPGNSPSGQAPSGTGNQSSGGGIESAANAKEIDIRTRYPDIVVYKTTDLQQPYPIDPISKAPTPCPKTKQAPVVVYMVAFDKVPVNQNNSVLGNITPDSLEASAFVAGDTPENQKLLINAKEAAIFAANKADGSRPAADRGKQVLYRYRVKFDPATCKK